MPALQIVLLLSSLAVALLAGSGNCSRDRVLFAGSGNCDGADYTCVNSPPELRSYILKANPLTLESAGNFSVGGLPSWTKTSPGFSDGYGGHCLFVTVTDSHYVLSYKVKEGHKMDLVSNITLAPGINPVHIDTQVGVLAVANYHDPDTTTEDNGESGVSTLTVDPDCVLTFAEYTPHHGRSVNPGRQGASHVHSVWTQKPRLSIRPNGYVYVA